MLFEVPRKTIALYRHKSRVYPADTSWDDDREDNGLIVVGRKELSEHRYLRVRNIYYPEINMLKM